MHNGSIGEFRKKIARKAREMLKDDLYNSIQGSTGIYLKKHTHINIITKKQTNNQT